MANLELNNKSDIFSPSKKTSANNLPYFSF